MGSWCVGACCWSCISISPFVHYQPFNSRYTSRAVYNIALIIESRRDIVWNIGACIPHVSHTYTSLERRSDDPPTRAATARYCYRRAICNFVNSLGHSRIVFVQAVFTSLLLRSHGGIKGWTRMLSFKLAQQTSGARWLRRCRISFVGPVKALCRAHFCCPWQQDLYVPSARSG